jgi:hypothetical protein
LSNFLVRIASVAELKSWHQSFTLNPELSQTKPIPTGSVRSASLATNEYDEAVTAGSVSNSVVNIGDEVKEADAIESCDSIDFGNNVKEDPMKAVDKGTSSDDDNNYEVLSQICKLEEDLLEMWNQGQTRLTKQQDQRILMLEEQLVSVQADNVYMESLLKVRDADFARYCDLERRERIQRGHLARKVENLEAQLEEKDHFFRLMQAKLDCMREADRISHSSL